MSDGFNADSWFVSVTDPILSALLDEIRRPSDLMVIRGDRMSVRNSNRTRSAMNVNRRFVGMESPITVSGGGRSYLAHCHERERARLLALVSNLDERRIVLEEIKRTRERGYAVRDITVPPRVGTIAVPVFAGHSLICTLNCIYLPNATSAAEVADRCLPALNAAAEQIGRTYGERQPARAFPRQRSIKG